MFYPSLAKTKANAQGGIVGAVYHNVAYPSLGDVNKNISSREGAPQSRHQFLIPDLDPKDDRQMLIPLGLEHVSALEKLSHDILTI